MYVLPYATLNWSNVSTAMCARRPKFRRSPSAEVSAAAAARRADFIGLQVHRWYELLEKKKKKKGVPSVVRTSELDSRNSRARSELASRD